MKIKYQLLNYFIKESSKTECHDVLIKENFYYLNLSEKDRKVFRTRTIYFMRTTVFESEIEFVVTNKMKLIISSAFTQITFGLNQDILNKFNTIFIAPKAYKYKHSEEVYDGDVNVYSKTINLSWPAVKNGFSNSKDGINLCIHEFGHSLILENSTKSYFDRIFNENELESWKVLAKQKIAKINSGRNQIFRDYAATNLMELFAVALELFFEKPFDFYNKEPQLFFSMCRLLKQDTRNKSNPLKYPKYKSF